MIAIPAKTDTQKPSSDNALWQSKMVRIYRWR